MTRKLNPALAQLQLLQRLRLQSPRGQLLTLSHSTVLKLLKMAVGMRALLDTVMQALPQVARRW